MQRSASLLDRTRWDFLPSSDANITPMRIGIIGCGPRAWYNAIPKLIDYAEYELTCLCDIRPALVERVAYETQKAHSVTPHTYTDYQQMIESEDLDAVIILVDADKQADIICDCLKAGLHVMAEVPLCYTMEDCWRIVTTVEQTGKHFLLMEQIRYAGYVQAWRQIVQAGVLGDIVLAEGEYFHNLPMRMYQDDQGVYYDRDHVDKANNAKPTWRAEQPSIVYLPHDLSPVLDVLDDRVTRVTGMQSPAKDGSDYSPMQIALMQTEKAVTLRMATSFATAAPERHWQHIKGTRGYVEMPRVSGGPYLMWAEDWQLPNAVQIPWGLERVDAPAAAVGSGHGDCDFYVFATFADAVLRNQPVAFDVYKAAEITAPAIAAADSINQGSVPIDVPNFRPTAQRRAGELPGAVAVSTL